MKKNVFVTGASSGIGRETALKFHQAGYNTLGCSRNPGSLPKDFPCPVIQMDLSSPASVDQGWNEVIDRLGHVDILVLNAGQGELGSVEDSSMNHARHLFEVNYFSCVDLVKKALPTMRKRSEGVIIFLGSIVNDLQFPFKAQYCGTKGALTGFALSLRYEVLPLGIRIHVIEPGWVRSSFHRKMIQNLPQTSPYFHRMQPFLDFSKDDDPGLPDGGDVAKVILKTAVKPSSPARIYVGKQSRLFHFVRHFLPYTMIERLILRKLDQKG